MKRKTLLGATVAILMIAASNLAFALDGEISVFKSEGCGCCGQWIAALKNAGLSLDVKSVDDMDAVKAKYHVPEDLISCHTSLLGPYVLEGHVPLEAIQKLQQEKPAIKGIAVGGMPSGALGMGSDPNASYDVIAFQEDGTQSIFLHMGK